LGFFRIELGDMSDLSQITDLLFNEFVPNEPIMRSTGIYSGDGKYEQNNKKVLDKFLKKNIKAGAIVVARNDTDKVVGTGYSKIVKILFLVRSKYSPKK
jgi:hypothetical protein